MNILLLCVIAVVACVIGYILAKYKDKKYYVEEIKKEKEKSARYLFDLRIAVLMVEAYMLNSGLDKMLRANNYSRVAIYGAAAVGRSLYYFLDSSEIEVVCFIDKRKTGEMLNNIPVRDLSNIDSNIDAIIVTPLTYFDEIYDDLKTKIDCPIIPITDIFGDE